MKKIFIGILGSAVLMSFYVVQTFSSTLFFTTKDGRLFCEADSFDGSYEECTLAETSGIQLQKAVFPNARLIETPKEKICVEYSTQVDMSLCQEEIDLMKKYLKPKPISSSGITNSGSSLSGVTSSGSIGTGTNTSVVSSGSIVNSGIAIEKEIHKQVQTVVDNIGTQDEWSVSLEKMYTICISNIGGDDCMSEIQVIIDMISKIGVYLVLAVVLGILYMIIFWFSMIGHAISHTIPRKMLWLPIVILLFFPGAVLYFFVVKKPFQKTELANLPKPDRSFF